MSVSAERRGTLWWGGEVCLAPWCVFSWARMTCHSWHCVWIVISLPICIWVCNLFGWLLGKLPVELQQGRAGFSPPSPYSPLPGMPNILVSGVLPFYCFIAIWLILSDRSQVVNSYLAFHQGKQRQQGTTGICEKPYLPAFITAGLPLQYVHQPLLVLKTWRVLQCKNPLLPLK